MVSQFVDTTGTVTGYKYRRDGWTPEQPPKKTWWEPGSVRQLFGLHLWVEQGCPSGTDLFICEGETDAMAVYQHTKALAFALSGKPSDDLWVDWVEIFHKVCGTEGTLYCCFDSDREGDQYTAEVSKRYKGKKLSLVLPSGVKDICQWYSEEGHPQLEWESLPKMPAFIKTPKVVNQEVKAMGNIFKDALSCGFPRLDYLGLGYYPGSFTMITAGSKAGKSSLTNQLVVQYIQLHKKKVMFLPLEMSVQETQQRLGACILGVNPQDVSIDELCQAADELDPYLLWIDRGGGVVIDELEQWYMLMENLGVSLFVIDPIQAATAQSTPDGDIATRSLDAFLYKLQELNHKYKVSCLVVTHSNDADSSIRINANQLRGSRALVQVATTVLGIQRLDEGQSVVYSVAPDRRFGRIGEVTMVYEKSQFGEVTRGHMV